MGVTVYPAPSAAAKSERTAIITATQSWTAPADVNSVDIFLVGGGGGGGGARTSGVQSGGGGGGGGITACDLSVTPGSSYTITIGAGGAAGVNSASVSPGSIGSDSTFGAFAKAYGGGGGQSEATYATGLVAASGGGGASSNSTQAGSGGGSAPWAMGSSTTWSIVYPSYGVVQGYYGIKDRNDGSGNPGINGFGAGGGGGKSTTGPSSYGGLNAGNGGIAFPSGVNATAALSGFGGGGGGASYNGPAQNAAASSGGSGICIIKYWSAL